MKNSQKFLIISSPFFLPYKNNLVIEGSGLLVSHEKTNTKEVACTVNVLYKEGEKTGNKIENIAKKIKTRKVKSLESPKWDFSYGVPVSTEIDQLILSVVVYEYGRGKKEFLGHIEVPLELLKINKSLDDWFTLQKRKLTDEVRGELHIKLDYLVTKELAKIDSSNSSQSKIFYFYLFLFIFISLFLYLLFIFYYFFLFFFRNC